MKKILAFIATVFVSLALSATSVSAAPATASFSIGASTSSVTNGNNFTVSISETGDAVNVVTAKFAYDASKLQYISASCGGSFPSLANSTSSSISCYTSTPVTGSAFVASVSFKAIGDTASTAISIAGGSQIASDGANVWNGNTPSTSVKVSTPTTPTQPTPPATPTSPTTPSGTTTTPNAPTTGAPQTNNTTKTTTTPDAQTTPSEASGDVKGAATPVAAISAVAANTVSNVGTVVFSPLFLTSAIMLLVVLIVLASFMMPGWVTALKSKLAAKTTAKK